MLYIVSITEKWKNNFIKNAFILTPNEKRLTFIFENQAFTFFGCCPTRIRT